MKFEKLFREVMSKINQKSTTPLDIYPLDVINAINDGIRAVILEAVNARTASSITVSQTVTPAVDPNFTEAYSAALTRPILQTTNVHAAVYNLVASQYTFDITAQPTAVKGQIGIKPNDDKVYVCVKSYTGGVQDETFQGHEIRQFALNDGGLYVEDQVISHNGSFWKVLQTFENNGIEVSEGALFTEVFWLQSKRKRYHRPVIMPFQRLQSGALQPETQAFVSFNQETVYTSPEVTSLYVQYVPEWQDASLEDTLDLPAEWESNIKNRAIRELAIKLGVSTNDDN